LNVPGVAVRQSMQTNATLVTPAWCRYFLEEKVRLGVSVDGPAFLTNRNRMTRSGRGAFDKIQAGIDLLREHRVPFHTISVLTRESLDYPDEIFAYFYENGIRRIAFNVEEAEGAHPSSSLLAEGDVGADAAYRAFMSRFYDLIGESASAEPFHVREFEVTKSGIAHWDSERETGAQQVTPGAIVSVDCHGNFSTWSPELLGLECAAYGDFALGNVMRDAFDSAFETAKFRAMDAAIRSGVAKCRESCAYFPFCGGGAPANKFFENGTFDSTETMFCRLNIKAVADVVLRKLERAGFREPAFPA